jgi:hypothetical protein
MEKVREAEPSDRIEAYFDLFRILHGKGVECSTTHLEGLL